MDKVWPSLVQFGIEEGRCGLGITVNGRLGDEDRAVFSVGVSHRITQV